MGCRKYKGRQYYDDLTGQTHLPEELEEMTFVFDGEALVIDLSDDNAAAFREAMAPFVGAARPASKSKVLATLPKRKRHLSVVPPSPPEEAPRDDDDFEGMLERSSLGSPVAKAIQALADAPEPQKGESVETRTEPEGTRVPETTPKPSDSSPPKPPSRPALTVVPKPATEPIPEQWAPYKPELRDDMSDRRLKARQWASCMGMELPNNMVTDEVLERWKGFYEERRWTRM